MYAAVMCPYCSRTRIIDLGSKSTVCPYCGQRCDTNTVRILFRGNNARLVRQHLTNMAGTEDAKKKIDHDPASTLEYRYSRARGTEAIRILAEGLSQIKEEFTVDDVRSFEPKNTERMIGIMLDEGVIIECRPGVYRMS